jgi:hypothetical protein
MIKSTCPSIVTSVMRKDIDIGGIFIIDLKDFFSDRNPRGRTFQHFVTTYRANHDRIYPITSKDALSKGLDCKGIDFFFFFFLFRTFSHFLSIGTVFR